MADDNPKGEAPLDFLTSVDEKVANLTDEVEGLDENLGGFSESVADLEGQVSRMASGIEQLASALGQDIKLSPLRPYDDSRLVQADTGESEPDQSEFEVPASGMLETIVLGWPAGAQQAVGLGIRDGAVSSAPTLIPRGPTDARFVAFDDYVLNVDVNERVEEGDVLLSEAVNNDSDNNHFVNVLYLIRED